MTTDQKLDQMLAILTGFIEKQEAFNTKQEAFNSKQEGTNSRFELSLASIRQDLRELRHDEELQHNMTHRLIMQAFEHISELQKEKEPWKA